MGKCIDVYPFISTDGGLYLEDEEVEYESD